ncbi:hypothetical protein EC912_103182 [Luteibacter rhizovicinus]|uniref:Uncharacterized protein n=1 Tax=Luteibacter rhizovicinus TaxID=242606 RepID=A0A4R3YPL4_9GAMM|nr:hypothetical protein EC912_103182 [Luteibacter rhizovicinus]
MTPPVNEWLTIVVYRVFHDIPRLILAVDSIGKFWIFDSKFDNERDDYSPVYIVYPAGDERDGAQRIFTHIADGSAVPGEYTTRALVNTVEFDQTRRQQLLIKSLREVDAI